MHRDPKTREIPFMPSTLETIDYALFDWINEEADIFTTTNKGWRKVPIIWASAERSYQIKHDKNLRDSTGALILPLMTIERISVVKDPAIKGTAWANIPPQGDAKGGSITIARRINQDKTSKFANADALRKIAGTGADQGFHGKINFLRKRNKKVVYETISIPMPVYLDITYKITVKTEYQQQINEIVTPFMTKTGGINYFNITRDGHRFEALFQSDFAQENNISSMDVEARQYQTSLDVKVLGYIIGQDKNQEQPKIVIRENAVEVKFPREQVMFDEFPEHYIASGSGGKSADKRGFYRD